MKNRKRITTTSDSAPDLTPMLDVVFILLIFFIVTASFLKESGLPINSPDSQKAETTGPSSMLIQIRSDNSVFVDGRKVDSRSVRSLVEQKRGLNPELSVVVRAHEEAKTFRYVEITDEVRKANIRQVSLLSYSD